MRFTRQSVAVLKLPPGKPYMIVWDDDLPGFGVRINEGGSRRWVVQYRASGKSRRETLGNVEAVPLDGARKAAKAKLFRAQLGGDPYAEKAEARARATITLGSVADRYLKYAKARLKPRSYEEVERHLTRHWAPIKGLPLHKITRALVAGRLGEIADENGPFASNRARAALSALFSWAMGEGLAESNPVIGTNKATDEISRDHVLSDAELTAIWQACREDDYGRIVRLLILTGQRREEVGAIELSEIDLAGALWTIPRERTKNGLPHEVALSEVALDILHSGPLQDGRPHIFGDGRGGFQGWSKAKAALDRRIAAAGTGVRPWRLHDIRRTMVTRLADLGTLPHVIEAVLNHVSGHRAGVAGINNRATYAKEKREALNTWANHVLNMAYRPPSQSMLTGSDTYQGGSHD
jgi:integrase